MKKPSVGIMRNISLSNISATGASEIGSSIHGIPGHMIENVSLSNINISYSGGGTFEDADKILPEKEEDYPESYMFGKLPAYGFYIRHVKNIYLDNIIFTYKNDEKRPALVCNDVEGINISGLSAEADLNAKSLILFDNVKVAVISSSRSLTNTERFISLAGERNSNIKLIGNDFTNVKKMYDAESGVIKTGGNLK